MIALCNSFLVILEFELRASRLLGRYSATLALNLDPPELMVTKITGMSHWLPVSV
jgi:hypothetical protein